MWGEDASPFEERSAGGNSNANPFSSSQAAPSGNDGNSGWGGSQQQASGGGGSSAPAPALSEKEKGIAKREAQLQEREKAIAERKKTDSQGRVKNWPFRCSPFNLAYHDIEVDCLPQYYRLTRCWYFWWFWNLLSLAINLIAVSNYIVGCSGHNPTIAGPFIAAIWVVFNPALSWIFVYRGCYNFGINPDKVNFVWLSVKIWIHVLFVALLGSFVPSGSGLYYVLDSISCGGSVATLCAISFCIWVVNFLLTIVFYGMLRQSWKSFDPKNVSVAHSAKTMAHNAAKEQATAEVKRQAAAEWQATSSSNSSSKPANNNDGWGSGGGW